MPMTKLDALQELLWEARRERSSRTAYRRVQRCLKVLGFTVEESSTILYWLEYHDKDGKPYAAWA